ncbi:MAG: hypothetical protein C4K48_06250 [Candidatus Thorarchaeota archaeon]|nr:MAG: hypothetical protein C4K48_06250 [Candidatus Thorarchaeota archaeon]
MKNDFTSAAIEILRQTKEGNIISHEEYIGRNVLEHFGLPRDSERRIIVDREKRVDIAMAVVGKGVDIAEVIGLLTWKDFEGLIATIMSENGFRCTESFRRRGNSSIRGMEIDVIGMHDRSVFSVDAKMWGIRGGKSSALCEAAVKQKERTVRLLAQREKLSEKLRPVVPGDYEFFPILVTWMVEDVELYEGVPVVPVFKFNTFILDFDTYRDLVVSYTGRL